MTLRDRVRQLKQFCRTLTGTQIVLRYLYLKTEVPDYYLPSLRDWYSAGGREKNGQKQSAGVSEKNGQKPALRIDVRIAECRRHDR